MSRPIGTNSSRPRSCGVLEWIVPHRDIVVGELMTRRLSFPWPVSARSRPFLGVGTPSNQAHRNPSSINHPRFIQPPAAGQAGYDSSALSSSPEALLLGHAPASVPSLDQTQRRLAKDAQPTSNASGVCANPRRTMLDYYVGRPSPSQTKPKPKPASRPSCDQHAPAAASSTYYSTHRSTHRSTPQSTHPPQTTGNPPSSPSAMIPGQ
ncbi:hypothetical protein G7Z17_g7935 [Cylindrodendrum hubeiense]|uniref:Uncharacterized protein n=1 Tax=Cylindrodendrum hubeiense TaxID=595255 RepID=A0A9P5H2W8_9HYPO|nr:hypothetical protein G7Z17_g7935 [Cylindrodendrum hubeiense]